MSRPVECLTFLVVAAASLSLSSTALAGSYGYCAHYSLYGREYIPYFSQHPPVYYSYPVPRPYGWSPYAYPPGVMTPPAKMPQAVQPAVFRNPYVDDAIKKPEPKGKTARVKPRVIENPYYVRVEQPGDSSDAVARTAAR